MLLLLEFMAFEIEVETGSGGRGPRRWYEKYVKKKKESRRIKIKIKNLENEQINEFLIEESDLDNSNIYLKESNIFTEDVQIYLKERLKKESNFKFNIREAYEHKSKRKTNS